MRLFYQLVLFSLLAPFSVSVNAKWAEYRSENFLVYSDAKRKYVTKTLGEFEQFRLAVLKFIGVEASPESDLLKIVIFADKETFYEYAGSENYGGFYVNLLNGPRMYVGPSNSKEGTKNTLFHEFSHYLMRQRSDLKYPMWYDEGFAELLGNADISAKGVKIGRDNSRRHHAAHTWQFLGFTHLLTPLGERDNARYWDLYYSSAWLAVHYFTFGTGENITHAKGLKEYLLGYHEGKRSYAAFSDRIGSSIAEIDNILRSYGRSPYLNGVNIAVPAYSGDVKRRVLRKTASLALQARLAYELGQTELVKAHLKKLNNKSNAPAAFKVLGLSLDKEMAYVEREQQIVSLLDGIPKDSLAHEYAAYFYLDYLLAEQAEERTNELLEKTLSQAAYALNLNQSNNQLRSVIWQAHQLDNKRLPAIKMMMEAYKRAPGNVQLNLVIGEYLSLGQKPELGRSFLQNVVAWSHSSSEIKRAKLRLEYLDSL